jgi:hypothetical protein
MQQGYTDFNLSDRNFGRQVASEPLDRGHILAAYGMSH